MTTFFQITQLPGPNPWSQYVTVSMATWKINNDNEKLEPCIGKHAYSRNAEQHVNTRYLVYYIFLELTGMSKPRMEKQKAPINPMNGEIVGTATANRTARVTSTVLWIKLFSLVFYSRYVRTKSSKLPQSIVNNKRACGEVLLDTIPDNFQADIELKAKRAINGQCNKYFYGLSRTV